MDPRSFLIGLAVGAGVTFGIMVIVRHVERRRLQREQDQLARDLADLDAAIDRVLKEHSK